MYPRSEASPIAAIPAEFRAQNPDLRRQMHYRLIGEKSSVYVGDYVAGVSVNPPYEGWDSFRNHIVAVLDILKDSGLIAKVERASMKATNVVDAEVGHQLAKLNISVSIAGRQPQEQGFLLRYESREAGLIRIVQVSPNNVLAHAASGLKRAGLLLSIDCIDGIENGQFWDRSAEVLENLHDETKKVFFDLITPETLAELGPEY